MKLEEQVVSLELAKRLKELGVKQEGNFVWVIYKLSRLIILVGERDAPCQNDIKECVLALTVAELGEMLPPSYHSYKTHGFGWWMRYESRSTDLEGYPTYPLCRGFLDGVAIEEKTEADARAKMLIHLLEKGIVKP